MTTFGEKMCVEKENFSENLVEVKNEISTLTLEIVFQNNLLFVSLTKLAKKPFEKCDSKTEIDKKS